MSVCGSEGCAMILFIFLFAQRQIPKCQRKTHENVPGPECDFSCGGSASNTFKGVRRLCNSIVPIVCPFAQSLNTKQQQQQQKQCMFSASYFSRGGSLLAREAGIVSGPPPPPPPRSTTAPGVACW